MNTAAFAWMGKLIGGKKVGRWCHFVILFFLFKFIIKGPHFDDDYYFVQNSCVLLFIILMVRSFVYYSHGEFFYFLQFHGL